MPNSAPRLPPVPENECTENRDDRVERCSHHENSDGICIEHWVLLSPSVIDAELIDERDCGDVVSAVREIAEVMFGVGGGPPALCLFQRDVEVRGLGPEKTNDVNLVGA